MTSLRLFQPRSLDIGVGGSVEISDQDADELGSILGTQRSNPCFDLCDVRRHDYLNASNDNNSVARCIFDR